MYSRGLPAPSAKGRAEAERRLRAQLAAVHASGARAVFIPGNHDWGAGGHEGWEAIRRQGRFVEEEGGPSVTFLPREGCPGPEVVDFGRLRLVLLDTQWWLHGGPKLQAPASGCAVDTEEEVVASLAGAIDGAGGRAVVVAGHHPLASGGPHGGHFSWTDHVFPLRAWRSWLWLPLPVVGSAYPLARRAGITAQDLASAPYEHFRAALERTFTIHPPLVYASGHEHNLQVLEGEGARRLLVSGAGILGHASRAVRTRATRFAAGEAGFMRMDLEEGGEARLGVLVVDATGAAVERFSEWLE